MSVSGVAELFPIILYDFSCFFCLKISIYFSFSSFFNLLNDGFVHFQVSSGAPHEIEMLESPQKVVRDNCVRDGLLENFHILNISQKIVSTVEQRHGNGQAYKNMSTQSRISAC